jgi:NAD(P)H-flavin reductase
MSRHLCGLMPGGEVEVSGPHGEYQWEKVGKNVESLILIGMGTGILFSFLSFCVCVFFFSFFLGITPLAQLAGAVADLSWSRGKKVEINLYMAYASPSDVLCEAQLKEIQVRGKGKEQKSNSLAIFFLNAALADWFKVHYFFSSESNRLSPQVLSAADLEQSTVCVCGTDQFVEEYRSLVPGERFHAF